jgi:nitrile hydratase accessory protein
MTAPAPALELQGPEAPPRSNGELVFAEPWESRAFGLAVALHAGGAFSWKDFSTRLAGSIAAWEREHAPGEEYSYYRCWLEALEALLEEGGILDRSALRDRVGSLERRPPGHDHAHGDHPD